MESKWRLNVMLVGLSEWGLSANDPKEHWSLVAELKTPATPGGRVFTHVGQLNKGSYFQYYLISLSSNGSADWFSFYAQGGNAWPPGTPPLVDD